MDFAIAMFDVAGKTMALQWTLLRELRCLLGYLAYEVVTAYLTRMYYIKYIFICVSIIVRSVYPADSCRHLYMVMCRPWMGKLALDVKYSGERLVMQQECSLICINIVVISHYSNVISHIGISNITLYSIHNGIWMCWSRIIYHTGVISHYSIIIVGHIPLYLKRNILSSAIINYDNGGFLKWGNHNSWMVHFIEIPWWMGELHDLGNLYLPFSGQPWQWKVTH